MFDATATAEVPHPLIVLHGDVMVGGARLTDALRAAGLDVIIGLRFRLPMVARRSIEAEARVVFRSTRRNTWGRWEIGAFYCAIEESDRAIVGREVIRLLTL